VLPPEAGFLLTNQNRFLIMETHFNNADLVKDSVDQSGFTLFYTDNLRQHEAGVLNTGDPGVTLGGSPVVTGKKYSFTCPSECTQNFREPVNVFASFLHMHLTGKEIYENRFAKNGTFLEKIRAVSGHGISIEVLLWTSAQIAGMIMY
jgi:Copper type II ascorbate-dependent monooxygenase, C-terminal domain